jgi:prenyltransferase beta subunit
LYSAIATILRTQHPKGGFGGGPAQNAHLLSNYAAVCTLAIMGSSSPDGGWDQIDRKAMYEWFMSLKEPDGSFLVCHHGEVDMRYVGPTIMNGVLPMKGLHIEGSTVSSSLPPSLIS